MVFDIVISSCLSFGDFKVKMTIQEVGEKHLVSLLEDLDLSNSFAFEKKVLETLKQGANVLIFDFSRVTYVDSSGIGTIVRIQRRLKEQGGEIILAGCCDSLMNIFQLINFPKYFRIYKTLEEALNS